jgi:hypothetical protein
MTTTPPLTLFDAPCAVREDDRKDLDRDGYFSVAKVGHTDRLVCKCSILVEAGCPIVDLLLIGDLVGG